MMGRREYEVVYLTNTPSFYKLKLMEEVGRRCRALVVFYGYGAEAVNAVLEGCCRSFDYEFIHRGDSNARPKVKTFLQLLRLMRRVWTRRVIFSGWLAPEYNLYAFLSARRRNVVVCESSILDVSLGGLKGWIKRRIIGRMSAALPSGQPHDRLFERIGFRGKRYVTGSVGIFNKAAVRPRREPNARLRYIYVGRLTAVKNLELLIKTFNANGLPLTIVGKGELENKLREMAAENISFAGFVDNEKLGEVYAAHDVFILPSSYEPWGLVVEEAVYWGLPVIVSDRVGSGEDIVRNLGTGEIFRYDSQEDLQRAIDTVSTDYQRYKDTVDAVDFAARDRRQVQAFIDAIKE